MNPPPYEAFFLLALLAVCGAAYYAKPLRQVLTEGGKVDATWYRAGDLVFALMLCAWFLASILGGFMVEQRRVSTDDMLGGGIVFVALILAVLAFTMFRKVSAPFGFSRLGIFETLKHGVFYLLSVYPLILLGMMLVSLFTGQEGAQPIVQYFLETKEPALRFLVIFFAVILAPLSEELLFRGYLYGVFKKHFGMSAAFLITALLFAFIHLHPPSLGVFLLLSFALTLAYEATGSIWVPMLMHALFNSVSVMFLIFAPNLGL